MAPARVHLLVAEPDFGAFLSPEERELAAAVTIPVRTLAHGPLELEEILYDAGAFGALILSGLVLQRLTVGDRSAMRLLGPGDLLTRSGIAGTEMLHQSREVSGETRLALLDDHMLAAAMRIPHLVTGLQVRLGEQYERLAAQLVICQMPRVEDRLLTLMWLLAETWGRVTASGTSLPLTLTHDALGELVGARRSTVTLAVTQLVEQGALMRQDRGWLLLERPPRLRVTAPGRAPELAWRAQSSWDLSAERGQRSRPRALTVEAISAMHEQHLAQLQRVQARHERAARSREHSRELRERISQRRRARRVPS